AEPLRFMDYLLRAPVRSVVLHGAGVAVTVPAPERFAVHKLIVSSRRLTDAIGAAKSRKDVMQAGELIVALKEGGRIDA
ncbi:GSU2403 family nucleotidyltransferase fold protein, partial [Proteus vulgaris]